MRFRQQRAQEPEVNLTPLIDVVFLLLIFFMVSTTFKEEAELEVILPGSSLEASTDDPAAIVIVIDADGRYEIDGTVVESGERQRLRQALANAVDRSRDDPIVIRADGRTPHQAVVTAMDVAAGLGLDKLAIETSTVSETAGD